MHCPKGEEVSLSLVESFGVDFGDFIGVESCVDLRSDLSLLEKEIISDRQINKCRRRDNSNKRLDDRDQNDKKRITEKEYPPPIPWLARTENLPSHMPWVMKKYNTDDGRLIIREEKVKRHEYFQAHRSNGRLTLRLVPLPTTDFSDDDDVTTSTENQIQSDEEGKEESMPSSTTSSDELSCICMESSDGEYYKSVRRNSSVFGMALPASYSPVRT